MTRIKDTEISVGDLSGVLSIDSNEGKADSYKLALNIGPGLVASLDFFDPDKMRENFIWFARTLNILDGDDSVLEGKEETFSVLEKAVIDLLISADLGNFANSMQAG